MTGGTHGFGNMKCIQLGMHQLYCILLVIRAGPDSEIISLSDIQLDVPNTGYCLYKVQAFFLG
jgi:hypothetical protein